MADLKTIAGLEIASVKTVAGLAMANVKTVAGLVVGGGGGGPVSGSFVSSGGSGSPSGTVTFSAIALGVADAARRIVISFPYRQGTLSSPTIQGISMTQVGSRAASTSALFFADIWYADVPTGTTGDLVFSAAGMDWMRWGAYRLVPSSSVEDSGIDDGSDVTVSLDVTDGAFVVACASQNTVGGSTWTTPTGIVEDFDLNPGSSDRATGASYESTATETIAVNVSLSGGGATHKVLKAASFTA